MKLIFIFLLFFSMGASASSVRTIDADALILSNHSNTLTLPSATTTLSGIDNVATLTHKTLDGSLNTFSKLPVATQMAADVFVANGTTTTLTLSNSTGTPSQSSLICSVNGIIVDLNTDYTYTAGTSSVVFVSAPATGQVIKCVYSKF